MIIYSPTLSGSTILSGSLKVSGSVFIKNTIIGSSSYALRSLTASYSLKSGAGGTTLITGSLYPITSSYATYAINALTNYTIATLSGTSIDWTNNTLEKNISTSETYTFTGVGTGSAIVVILNNTGSNNILPTFPITVKWANSLYPTNILPNATSIYTFLRSKKYILASSTENYQ